MESVLLQSGFRVNERVQHDATQTMWRLTSAKRVSELRVSSATVPKQIKFTCDFLRTSQAVEFGQKGNLTKIFDIMAGHVKKATTCSVSMFPNLPDAEYQDLARRAYAGFGLTPSLEAWAHTYHLSSLCLNDDAEARMIDLLKNELADSIVVSFETSPMLRRVFERCAIAHIDIRPHSQRFMDDLPLGFSSSSSEATVRLNTYRQPNSEFEGMAHSLRNRFLSANIE